jgi:hypothetical protein
MAKLDPDKIAPRRFDRLKYFDFMILYHSYSIRVKCDVVKPRKPAIDIRPPLAKPSQQIKPDRSASKYAPVKIGLFILFVR